MREKLLAGIANELRIGNYYFMSANVNDNARSQLEKPDMIELP